MKKFVSEIVERKLHPRRLCYFDGEIILVLGILDKQKLDARFHISESLPLQTNELAYVNLDDLCFDIQPKHQPAGFIYHLGRCGSTTAVNMLNSLDHIQLISEATIIHSESIAQKFKPLQNCHERRKKLMDLFCLLGESENCKTIFKMASWEARLTDVYSGLYPEVKSCLVVRDILEIMVAILEAPTGRFQRNKIRAKIEMERRNGSEDFLLHLKSTFGVGLDYLKKQSYVDFIGNALRAQLEEVKRNRDFYDLMIDHKEITNRVATDICPLFGITVDEQEIEMMQHKASYDSKSGQNRKYIDDSGRKAIEATPETRKWCENTLQPLLDQIINNNKTSI